MTTYKKNSSPKISTKSYKSYCIICRKNHELNPACNKTMSEFVRHHLIGIFQKANPEEKKKLIYILHESRLGLISKINESLPNLVEDYMDSKTDVSTPNQEEESHQSAV